MIRAVAEEPIKEPAESFQPEILLAPLESDLIAEDGEEIEGIFTLD